MVQVKVSEGVGRLSAAGSVGPVGALSQNEVPCSDPMSSVSFVRSNAAVLYARAPQRPSLAGSGVPVRQDAANASLSFRIQSVSLSLGMIVKGGTVVWVRSSPVPSFRGISY